MQVRTLLGLTASRGSVHNMNMESNIPKIRELTQRLSGAPKDEISWDLSNTVVKVKILSRSKDMEIMDGDLPAGSRFPVHKHKGREVLTVYKGRIFVQIEGKEHSLGVGDSLTIEAGLAHFVWCHEDSKVVAITIPADEDFDV